MNGKCKHEWTYYTLHGITHKCKKCGRYGREEKRYNRETGRDEYVVRMIPRG
jgi:hypothetical protein